eukprot:11191249-Alexandrium_andersonii.AAC.1
MNQSTGCAGVRDCGTAMRRCSRWRPAARPTPQCPSANVAKADNVAGPPEESPHWSDQLSYRGCRVCITERCLDLPSARAHTARGIGLALATLALGRQAGHALLRFSRKLLLLATPFNKFWRSFKYSTTSCMCSNRPSNCESNRANSRLGCTDAQAAMPMVPGRSAWARARS